MTTPHEPVELSIVIPFHREEATISPLLLKLQESLAFAHETLLVHDDPNDPTLAHITEIKKSYPAIRTLLNMQGRGAKGALLTGMASARAQTILLLVADDLGAVPVIDDMLKLIRQGYDLVSVTRYAPGGGFAAADPWARRLSSTANRLFLVLTACTLSDNTCGIKMFRQEILKDIVLTGEEWSIAFELSIEAQYRGLKVAEVPFVSSNRPGGKSHFRILPRIAKYGRVFLQGVWKLRKRRHE